MTLREAIAVLGPLRTEKRCSIKIEPPGIWLWGHSQEVETTKWQIWVGGNSSGRKTAKYEADTLEMAVKMVVEHLTESRPSLETAVLAADEANECLVNVGFLQEALTP